MLGTCLDQVRKAVPLVHNITNYVTVNDVANILLACGGSPIMSDEPEDVEDITAICGGLNINIGTLNQQHQVHRQDEEVQYQANGKQHLPVGALGVAHLTDQLGGEEPDGVEGQGQVHRAAGHHIDGHGLAQGPANAQHHTGEDTGSGGGDGHPEHGLHLAGPQAREAARRESGTARKEEALTELPVGRIMIARTMTALSTLAPPVN